MALLVLDAAQVHPRAALQAADRAGGDDMTSANLKKLDAAGMLESFILFARPDDGIALDYVAYRNDHRDTLRKFWTDFVVGAPLSK